MLRTRWYKVFIDLWSNRGRTLIVALAIAVGVYSVGVIVDVQELILREDALDQATAKAADTIILTYPFEDDLAQRIAEVPGVGAAEGRARVDMYAYATDGERKDMLVTAVPDFDNMQVDSITLLDGAWPLTKNEIVVERLVLDYLGVNIGDALAIELTDGAQKQLIISGVAHDSQQFAPDLTDRGTGYITPNTMGSLGYGEQFNEMRLRIADEITDEAEIKAVNDAVEDQIERSGRPILSSSAGIERPQDAILDTVVLILSTFGIIILLLSGFLVVNAINALITQQTQQIGVMKLIGGSRLQVMSMYFVTVLIYGLIAIAIGIPLSIISAQLLMTQIVQDLMNVLPDSLSISWELIVAQIAVGILLPLLAGLQPVLKGTRTTTHQALNDSGMVGSVGGHGITERLLGWLQTVRSVQRPYLLAIRNTLRHKARLAQTLIVLIIGTALFISVLSVNSSVNATLVNFLNYHQYDVSLRLARPYRSEQLQRTAQEIPGVEYVETWSVSGGTRTRPDDSDSDPFRIYAIPLDTQLLTPQIVNGRWLKPEDNNAVVINSDVLDKESDIQVGGPISVNIGGRELDSLVVGIARTDSQGPSIYMNYDDYAYFTRTPDKATHVQVVATNPDVDQELFQKQIFAHFEDAGFEVSGVTTQQQINAQSTLMFTIIVAFLILMALLLAAVGGLGLTTTMSINILERIREIGVLRAIGASNFSVRQIVLAEGLVIGLLSWTFGTILSFPISAFLSEQVGLALLKVPLNYQYSILAALLWLVALLGIAVAASLGPARNAVQLTIREVLAYE